MFNNLGKTKNDRGRQDASPDLTESNNLHRSVTYSIADIVPFVNSKDVLRYLPDDMPNEKQKSAKWEAIADTTKRTNDKNDKGYIQLTMATSTGDVRIVPQTVNKSLGLKPILLILQYQARILKLNEY